MIAAVQLLLLVSDFSWASRVMFADESSLAVAVRPTPVVRELEARRGVAVWDV